MNGVEIIEAEHRRQIGEGKLVPDGGRDTDDCQMIEAAICYLLTALGMDPDDAAEQWWPDEWGLELWRPAVGLLERDLATAGALIAAELDRRLRDRALGSDEGAGIGGHEV